MVPWTPRSSAARPPTFPARRRTSRQSLKTAVDTWDLTAFKTAITGLAVSINGVTASLTALKVDITVLKLANHGINLENYNMKIHNGGFTDFS